MTTFGAHLRDLRRAAGLDQRQFAARVDARMSERQKSFDYIYLSKIENERVNPPSPAIVRAIAAELNADVDELAWMAGHMPEGMNAMFRNSPGARAFWIAAAAAKPSETEWARLTQLAEQMRK
jgi:transcriptional regulator with XRE-family HTH domain